MRITELLKSGRGLSVAPAGKVFKEEVEIRVAKDRGPHLEEALDVADQ